MNASHFKRFLPRAVIPALFDRAWSADPAAAHRLARPPGSGQRQCRTTCPALRPGTRAAADTKLDSCSTCHTAALRRSTPMAWRIGTAAAVRAALAAIEPTDSDGDSWTNLQEIQALTFPGNAADHPAAARSNGYQHGGSDRRGDQHRRPHAQRDQHPGPDWHHRSAHLPAVCRPSVTARAAAVN